MANFDINIVKDPSIFEQNRLKAHSDHVAFSNYRELSDGSDNSLRQSLNGSWFFHYAKNFGQMPAGIESDEFDVSGWSSIKVPGHFETQGYGKPHYTNICYPWNGHEDVKPGQIPTKFNPVGSYVTFFDSHWDWKNTFICFEGVDSAYAVFLNGHYVGYATGSFTPSDFDLTPYIRNGQNRLAVRVFKYSSGSHLEDQDFWRLSGIFRGVYLYTKPEVHLDDIFVKATLDDSYSKPILTGKAKLNAPGAVQLSLVDGAGKIASKCFKTDESKNCEIDFELDVSGLDIKPWSAEHPNLYALLAQCLTTEAAEHAGFDQDGAEAAADFGNIMDVDESACEASIIKVGFRRFEMKDGIMCINGKRIVFNGVNRHEFSPIGGRTVPEAEIYSDLLTMKRNNINAVRTSHYPNSSCFYAMCDELGLYVIDETNLETHGTWQGFGYEHHDEYTLPDGHPEWHDAVIARGEAMLERDKNHACVIIWSCGNESFGGQTLFDLSNYFRKADPSRLVHYEGLFHDRRFNGTSDMESQMYTTVANVKKFLAENTDKPFIMCEYTHAMGQSCGGMKLYTDLAKVEPRYQGGFIWDWKDQAFISRTENGDEYYAYGGDFDDYPTEFNFSGNGIVFADGSETSKMTEVKFNYQNFVLEPSKNKIKITNYSLFTNTDEYVLCVQLLLNGTIASSYEDIVSVAPGESVEVPVSLSLLDENLESDNFDKDSEYTIQAFFELKEDTPWAKAGFEVAFGESVIHAPECYVEIGKKSQGVELIATDFNYGVVGDNFNILFGQAAAAPISYRVGGIEYLSGQPKANFWRAPTDNDRGNKMPFRDCVWRNAGQHAKCVKHSAESFGDYAVINFTMQLATEPVEAYVEMKYTVYSSGQVRLDLDYSKAEGLPEIPEFGVLMPVKRRFSDLEFYGRGPTANYTDRKAGYKLGYYASSAIEEFELYLRPQECGNHCDTRYFIVREENGDHGMIFTCVDKPFNFSVLPWTPYQIEEALHPYELPETNRTIIKINSDMTGVGGDDSWGSPVLPEYVVDNDNRHLSFVFQGF